MGYVTGKRRTRESVVAESWVADSAPRANRWRTDRDATHLAKIRRSRVATAYNSDHARIRVVTVVSFPVKRCRFIPPLRPIASGCVAGAADQRTAARQRGDHRRNRAACQRRRVAQRAPAGGGRDAPAGSYRRVWTRGAALRPSMAERRCGSRCNATTRPTSNACTYHFVSFVRAG